MMKNDPLFPRVKAFCRRWDMLPGGGTVLCAVSGGRDSMALLHMLSRMAGEEGVRLAAAHYNHQLRASARRDEEFVRCWCGEHHIPLACRSEDVAAYAEESGASLEDAARRLRYRFLEEAARDFGADRIATAHHRDDQAETVLLHLLRGSGLQGLGGIPAVRGKIVRPLLEVSRAEIDGYVQRWAVPFVEDETNQDVRFTRNRLRAEVLPLLEAIAPGCGGRIAGTASLLRDEDEHLRREAEALLRPMEDGRAVMPLAVLEGLDAALRRRVVRGMGRQMGLELSRNQVEAVLALPGGGCQDLPGGIQAVRLAGRLTLRRRAKIPGPLALHPGEQSWGGWRVCVRADRAPVKEDNYTAVLRRASGQLAIAACDGTGRLAVGEGRRTVKRLFADRGIPVERRAGWPMLLLDGKAAAVFGVATDQGLTPAEGEACVVVSLERDTFS